MLQSYKVMFLILILYIPLLSNSCSMCFLLSEFNYHSLSSGQPFSDYYGGKTVKRAIGSSINFTWTILRPFTRVEWGLAVTPYAFETPPRLLVSYLKEIHYQLHPQQRILEECRGKILEVRSHSSLET